MPLIYIENKNISKISIGKLLIEINKKISIILLTLFYF